MIEWCAMIFCAGFCSEGFVLGGLRGDGADLEGGVGHGDEKKGAFLGGKGGGWWWCSFLKVLTPKSPWQGMWRGFYIDAGGQGRQLGVPQGTTAAETAAGGEGRRE